MAQSFPSFGGGGGRLAFGGQREVQQAVGVVVGGAEHLAAGHVLVDGADATADEHGGGVERRGIAEAGQGGADGFRERARAGK